MGYAELIQTLEQLPEDKQSEVLDFAKFLAQRFQPKEIEQKTLAESSLARWINNPLGVENFQPMSREEANAR
ncbi:DUF2281 domain-containing protein [Allochromatium palmeri]|uniref:DUF2281 domain-containing protein n=1 Tax=Allochromatium palmeri TaxID=231048 RepID=A0A6N8EBN2_9GAMM|nr:DUF2281 domain-containing protein [Allochromatium palmeri]MTW21633.1 DUF2281 domain-containing protein [Allochromatium palmeri]